MDIKLEKKPWYIRYRYYLAGGVAFLAFLIYVVTLSLGPSKLRIEQDNIQIAEVKNGKFMEYVDVEGVIQPILTIKVNAREAGSVERIIGEEGSLLRQGDTILVMENPDLLRSIEDQRDDWEKQLITYREKEIEQIRFLFQLLPSYRALPVSPRYYSLFSLIIKSQSLLRFLPSLQSVLPE